MNNASNTALARVTDLDPMELGAVFAKSGFFSDSRDAAQAVVKILAGRELGFPPVASMTGVFIVKGKVCLSANLMASAIKRSSKYTYKVRHLDDQGCAIEFFEGKESIGTSEFSAADAKRQGTQNVDRFPRNMFFARAISNGAKWYTPDIFGGPVYTPDELGLAVDAEGEVIASRGRTTVRRAAEPAADERPQLPPAEDVPTIRRDDPLADDDEWREALDAAFQARGFDVPQADAAIDAVLKKKGAESVVDLALDDRNAFAEAVKAGKFDKYKALPVAVA